MKLRDENSIRGRLTRAWKFLSDDVWDVEISSMGALGRWGVNAIRIMHLIFRGYREDECPLHAAALTFNTLMSIVPVLALSLSIAKGFGAGDVVQTKIRGFVYSQLEQFQVAEPIAAATDIDTNVVSAVTNMVPTNGVTVCKPCLRQRTWSQRLWKAAKPWWIRSMACLGKSSATWKNINFAALGGLGLAVLLWTVVAVLGRVESSFNQVWGVSRDRSMLRKFTDYMGVLILIPFLILMASSLPAIDMISRIVPEGLSGPMMRLLDTQLLKHVTAIGLVALSFALFIMVMPNTRVRFGPGFCGGLVAGLLFVAWLWICVRVQVGAARMGTIYVGFAIVPIVLLWVLISWHIVLFGAEVAFAVQNCSTFRAEQTARRASTESRIILALSIISEAAQALEEGAGAWDSRAYANEKNIPVRLLNEVLSELCTHAFLAEIADRENCYALLKKPEAIQKRDIVEAMMKYGENPESLGLDKLTSASDKLLPEAWTESDVVS